MIKHLALICLIAILYSCGGNKKTKTDKTVFRYNEAAGITSLDPAFARDQANIWAVNQVYNGLVQMDDNLNIKSCIARSWEISEDGLARTKAHFVALKPTAFVGKRSALAVYAGAKLKFL